MRGEYRLVNVLPERISNETLQTIPDPTSLHSMKMQHIVRNGYH